MLLYPRLDDGLAKHLARDRAERGVEELAGLSSLKHESCTYGPLGGTRVDEGRLRRVREEVRRLASDFGYPAAAAREGNRRFDFMASTALHREMDLTASEASRRGVWQFVCCVLLPDVVRWRYYSDGRGTNIDRFLGGVRNTLGRLWWRAFILHDRDDGDSYGLLRKLNEDELVQLMERPHLAGDQRLTKTTARAFFAELEREGAPPAGRMTLMREAQKRVMRLRALMAFEAMSDPCLERCLTEVFREARPNAGASG